MRSEGEIGIDIIGAEDGSGLKAVIDIVDDAGGISSKPMGPVELARFIGDLVDALIEISGGSVSLPW